MPEVFDGFTAETTEILMGIRMNNTKEWYQAHKEAYAMHVRKPTILLADECCAYMQKLEVGFTPRPKVSRPYRDTRFANNKDPIKECIWFFLRNDTSPGIQHDEPTYFFEVSPDWWRMGLGYWPMKASGMAAFRKKVAAAPAIAAHLVSDACEGGAFSLEADRYKKKMHDGSLIPEAADLMQMKNLTFMRHGQHDTHMCSGELLNTVCEGFQTLFPLYQFFMEVSRVCNDTKPMN